MIEERIHKLDKKRKMVLLTYGIEVILLIISIVVLFYHWHYGILLLNVSILFYLFGARTADRAYRIQFILANLETVYETVLDELTVSYKKHFSQERFKTSGLLPKRIRGNVAITYSVEGKIQEDAVLIGELLLCYEKECSVKKQKFGTKTGVWVEIQRQHGSGEADTLKTFFLEGKMLDFDVPLRGELSREIIGFNRLPEVKELLKNRS